MYMFDDESEKEDDWGWFISLEMDVTTTNKKVKHICKSLQTIDENEEYHDTPSKNKNTHVTFKTKFGFFRHLLMYGLFYNCLYLEYIYKCINPFSYYKQKTSN